MKAGSRTRAGAGQGGDGVQVAAGQDADLAGADRAAVHAAEQERGQGLRGRRLVQHPAAGALQVRAEPGADLVQAGAEEDVGGHEPGRQLAGMQVPALVEAALQRPADQPGVQRPGGVHVVARRRPGAGWSSRR